MWIFDVHNFRQSLINKSIDEDDASSSKDKDSTSPEGKTHQVLFSNWMRIQPHDHYACFPFLKCFHTSGKKLWTKKWRQGLFINVTKAVPNVR